jgi:excisionase family DNA binding protein
VGPSLSFKGSKALFSGIGLRDSQPDSSRIHRCLLKVVLSVMRTKAPIQREGKVVDSDEQEEEAKPISDEPTYTTGETARLLGVSTGYVHTRIASGELPTHRDERGRHLIPQDAVHALLEERRRAARELRPDLLRRVPSRAAREATQEEKVEVRELRGRVEALQRELEQERRRSEALAEQVESLHQRPVEKVEELLRETVDDLLSHSSQGHQVEARAREALSELRPHAEAALEALELVEGHRGLTDEEWARQRAFKRLLAASRAVA